MPAGQRVRAFGFLNCGVSSTPSPTIMYSLMSHLLGDLSPRGVARSTMSMEHEVLYDIIQKAKQQHINRGNYFPPHLFCDKRATYQPITYKLYSLSFYCGLSIRMV